MEGWGGEVAVSCRSSSSEEEKTAAFWKWYEIVLEWSNKRRSSMEEVQLLWSWSTCFWVQILEMAEFSIELDQQNQKATEIYVGSRLVRRWVGIYIYIYIYGSEILIVWIFLKKHIRVWWWWGSWPFGGVYFNSTYMPYQWTDKKRSGRLFDYPPLSFGSLTPTMDRVSYL